MLDAGMLVRGLRVLPEGQYVRDAVPVGAGIAAAAPAILRVGDHLAGGQVVPSTLHHALVGDLSRRGRRCRGGAASARSSPVAVSGPALPRGSSGDGGMALAGPRPRPRLRASWRPEIPCPVSKRLATVQGRLRREQHDGRRLISGLGSNRYDFFRVALDDSSPIRCSESGPTTSSSSICCTVAAGRPPATPQRRAADPLRRACSGR